MSSATSYSADLCVIGSGVAGLTVARRAIDAGLRVVVVESGEWERDAVAQALGDGELDSRYYERDAIQNGRRRQFGGTANDWTHVTRPGTNRDYARTLPGERVDFEAKAWMPESGWPVSYDDLLPYYEAAQRLWIAKPLDNDVTSWVNEDRPLLPLSAGRLTSRMAQYGPNDVFTTRFRDDLVRSGLAQLVVGATVVDFESTPAGEVVAALAVRADGSPLRIAAASFVLACGGVENVQALLGSGIAAPGGVGNRHDVVGRYVTDHPEYRMARIVPSDPGLLDRLRLYDIFHAEDGQMLGAVLTLDEDLKRDEGLLNMGSVLIPQPAAFGSAAERAMRALRAREARSFASSAAAMAAAPLDTLAVLRMRADKARGRFDYPGGHVWHRGGWSRDGFDRSPFTVLEVHAATEQTPERDNRIELSDRRDRLGRRRVRARLHWSDADRDNLTRSMRLFGEAVEGSGLGAFEPWVTGLGSRRPVQTGWHHPMSGTRMHEDARYGAVDADCRVHGTANLFVAGSSTFTTSLGYSNPTLTVVALAIRLAEHLAGGSAAAPALSQEDLHPAV